MASGSESPPQTRMGNLNNLTRPGGTDVKFDSEIYYSTPTRLTTDHHDSRMRRVDRVDSEPLRGGHSENEPNLGAQVVAGTRDSGRLISSCESESSYRTALSVVSSYDHHVRSESSENRKRPVGTSMLTSPASDGNTAMWTPPQWHTHGHSSPSQFSAVSGILTRRAQPELDSTLGNGSFMSSPERWATPPQGQADLHGHCETDDLRASGLSATPIGSGTQIGAIAGLRSQSPRPGAPAGASGRSGESSSGVTVTRVVSPPISRVAGTRKRSGYHYKSHNIERGPGDSHCDRNREAQLEDNGNTVTVDLGPLPPSTRSFVTGVMRERDHIRSLYNEKCGNIRLLEAATHKAQLDAQAARRQSQAITQTLGVANQTTLKLRSEIRRLRQRLSDVTGEKHYNVDEMAHIHDLVDRDVAPLGNHDGRGASVQHSVHHHDTSLSSDSESPTRTQGQYVVAPSQDREQSPRPRMVSIPVDTCVELAFALESALKMSQELQISASSLYAEADGVSSRTRQVNGLLHQVKTLLVMNGSESPLP